MNYNIQQLIEGLSKDNFRPSPNSLSAMEEHDCNKILEYMGVEEKAVDRRLDNRGSELFNVQTVMILKLLERIEVLESKI